MCTLTVYFHTTKVSAKCGKLGRISFFTWAKKPRNLGEKAIKSGRNDQEKRWAKFQMGEKASIPYVNMVMVECKNWKYPFMMFGLYLHVFGDSVMVSSGADVVADTS